MADGVNEEYYEDEEEETDEDVVVETTKYYVCGAIYATSGHKFRLVTPGKGIPYVWDYPTDSSEFHAHLYELSDDRKSVTLVKQSPRIFTEDDLKDCGAPETAVLCESNYKGVMERIAKGDIYSRFVPQSRK